ncbi:MAG: cell division protein FtsW [Clostridia bacterium]|nr:cell division protein FtsW [Clostridia bacterium]
MNNRDDDYFVKRSVTREETAKKDTSVHGQVKRPYADERIRPSGDDPRRRGSERAVTVPTKENDLTKKTVNALTFEKLEKPGSIDTVFLLLLLMVITVGTVMSFSASYAYAEKKYDDSYYLLIEHLKNLLFAALFFIGAMFSPPEIYKAFTYIITVISVILLILVLFVGVVRNGAKRWIDPPLFPMFQPSELAKLALVMILSLYLNRYSEKVESKKLGTSFLYGIVFPMMMFGVFLVLLYFENHFSAIIIFFCITFFMLIIGKTKPGWILLIVLVAFVGIGLLISFSDYAVERIKIWQDPWADPSGDGWQTIQGLYAIASGGIFGVGLGNSRQKYGYVSEPQNDFIFTIVCEELGFVGALAVIVLFAALILRGFYIARKSPNRFTYYLVMGLMIKLALQVGFNIAVVTNTFPNTGISLPFFSSGGTQLVLQMIEMGLVLSVSRYCHLKK